MALALADRLHLDPEQRTELVRSLDAKQPAAETAEKIAYEPLDMDQFRLISEWKYFALLSLARKNGVANNPEEISMRLGISTASVRKTIEVLRKLNLIVEEEGRLKRTMKALTTSDGEANLAIRKAHLEDCELAAKSLESDAIESRDFSSITFRLDPSSLAKVAAIAREAQDNVMQLSDAESGEEVFRMSVHIFPLTRFSQKETQK